MASTESLRKVFSRDLQRNLFPSNEFYKGRSKVDGGINANAKQVEVPIAGGKPGVIVNPETYPLQTQTRTDSKKVYDVDYLATEPFVITDHNEALTNYNKRADILQDHINVLNETIANRILNNWAPTKSSQIVRTSGANDNGHVPDGATGTRKEITYSDFLNVQQVFNSQDIPQEGRFCIVPSELFAELLQIKEFISSEFINTGSPVSTGAVGRILNFDIFVRSRTTRYTNASPPQPKDIGSSSANADNFAALFWHRSFVRYAEGNVQTYINENQAVYQGTVASAGVRSGGTKGRDDEKGTVALVQKHGA